MSDLISQRVNNSSSHNEIRIVESPLFDKTPPARKNLLRKGKVKLSLRSSCETGHSKGKTNEEVIAGEYHHDAQLRLLIVTIEHLLDGVNLLTAAEKATGNLIDLFQAASALAKHTKIVRDLLTGAQPNKEFDNLSQRACETRNTTRFNNEMLFSEAGCNQLSEILIGIDVGDSLGREFSNITSNTISHILDFQIFLNRHLQQEDRQNEIPRKKFVHDYFENKITQLTQNRKQYASIRDKLLIALDDVMIEKLSDYDITPYIFDSDSAGEISAQSRIGLGRLADNLFSLQANIDRETVKSLLNDRN